MKRSKRLTKRERKAALEAIRKLTILEPKRASKQKFPLSEYLKKKSLRKAEKLVHRDQKRQAKLEAKGKKPEHNHDHEHEHEHEHE